MSRVSVIIPTYNCARYVESAIKSVLEQTFEDYEIVVVDDGSTDETRLVLQPYETKITYIYQENQERSAARNTGIRASSGEYVAFLDADDLWLPDKLERQVAVLDQHPHVPFTYCQAWYMDANGHLTRYLGEAIYGESGSGLIISDRSRDLIFGNVISGGGSNGTVRRSALEKVGLFDETLSYPEDWDLWARVSRIGPFAYLAEPLICYRVFGWRKVLAVEASERLVAQHLRVIEKAISAWAGEPGEKERLHAQATSGVYIRAALANYQLDQAPQGQTYLENALKADPELVDRERLIHLAVDRAKLIESEAGSYREAEAFIDRFFSHLPAVAAEYKNARREAVGWLYLAGALERRRDRDATTIRRLLAQGVAHAPVSLKNLGVISTAMEAYLGSATANALRITARRISRLAGKPPNA